MISRVAENCFWLTRYVERAETSARLVSVNRLVILDADIHEAERWKPIVVVCGEQERFEKLVGSHGYDKDELAEEYLTWSQDTPSSIRSSLASARENARMSREVISREMWETINTAWQWLNGASALREYKKDRLRFHQTILRMCAEFHGDCHSTMLHEEPFDFIRLGMLLERANQTARVVDVKHHWFATDRKSAYETPQESAQWMGLLRLCAAVEPFFKRHSAAPTGPLVLRFLLQDLGFPRSLLHCLDRTRNFIERIDAATERPTPSESLKLARKAAKRARTAPVGQLDATKLHQKMTQSIVSVADICNQVSSDFFDISPHI